MPVSIIVFRTFNRVNRAISLLPFLPDQDCHYGFLDTINCTFDRLCRSRFSHFSLLSGSSGPGRGQLCLLRVRKRPEMANSKRFLRHLSVPSLLRPVSFLSAPYPAGTGILSCYADRIN